MSIYSTDTVTKEQAREILLDHLKEVRRKVKADPDMAAHDLDVLLNTYVCGNAEYWHTNFMVIE